MAPKAQLQVPAYPVATEVWVQPLLGSGVGVGEGAVQYIRPGTQEWLVLLMQQLKLLLNLQILPTGHGWQSSLWWQLTGGPIGGVEDGVAVGDGETDGIGVEVGEGVGEGVTVGVGEDVGLLQVVMGWQVARPLLPE